MLILERCVMCDSWLDPANLDEVFFHGFASCIEIDAEMPATGIRGELVDEEPQG